MTSLQVGDLCRVVNPSPLAVRSFGIAHGDVGMVKTLSHDGLCVRLSPTMTQGMWVGIYRFYKDELEKIE